jgi:hypothetical protein
MTFVTVSHLVTGVINVMDFNAAKKWKRLLWIPLCMGCTGADFPMARVTGTVTCEGQPVAKAIVYFEPLKTGDSALVGKQGFALTDESGKFNISTYGENDGAVVGKHLLRVGRSESSGKCDCVLAAEQPLMEVEVKPGQTNDFSLALKKASAQEKKREAALIKANADD